MARQFTAQLYKTFSHVKRFFSCTVPGQKPILHVQHLRLTEKQPVDMKETYRCLKSSNLPAATEGLVVAAQDQALRTRYYERNVMHRDVSPTCRLAL